jgi:hypothetical protein
MPVSEARGLYCYYKPWVDQKFNIGINVGYFLRSGGVTFVTAQRY